jgi:metal-responsive CopG/Arc/MetJ family transcriptional regulator
MQRISVRVDDRLKWELEAEARAQGVQLSNIIRQVLERHLRERTPRMSALQLAEKLGIIGCFKDAPSDLSTNPKYMEGFGGVTSD